MSTTFTTFLMIGACIPEDDFPGEITDERWSPYMEGHTGVEMRIIQSAVSLNADRSRPIFVGKVLAQWSKWDGNDGFTRVTPTADFLVVDQFLKEYFHIESRSTLMFCAIAN